MPSPNIRANFCDEAYVLYTSPWRETSLLAEIFTKSHGRIRLNVKGGRAARSIYRGQLLAFHKLEINWRGKSEVPALAKVEWIGKIAFLNKSGLVAGFYLNELIMQLLTRGDAHPQLFDLYDHTISTLCQQLIDNPNNQILIEKSLRNFEVGLIREIGYGIDFEKTAEHGEKINCEEKYYYIHNQGVFSQNTPIVNASPDEIVDVSGKALIELAKLNNNQKIIDEGNNRNNSTNFLPDKEIMREQKLLLRAIINNIIAPAKLRSRKLISNIHAYRFFEL